MRNFDAAKHREIFEIIHPYIMSPEDIEEVAQAGDQIQDLWLVSFAVTQKGMIGTTLSYYTKQYFQYFSRVKALFQTISMAPLWGFLLDRRSCNGKL